MQVIVNCKKKLIDYSTNYRSIFRNRYKAKKSFVADFTLSMQDGSFHLVKADDGQEFLLDVSNTRILNFFLDGNRPFIEAVIAGDGDQLFSFTIAPVADNSELGQQGVIAFRGDLEALSCVSGVPVTEYIDPNPLGICPDDAEDMEELIAMRTAEGADIMFTGEITPQDTSDFQQENAPATFADEDFDEAEVPDEIFAEETQILEPVSTPDMSFPSATDGEYDSAFLGMEDLTEEDFEDFDLDEFEVDDYIPSITSVYDDSTDEELAVGVVDDYANADESDVVGTADNASNDTDNVYDADADGDTDAVDVADDINYAEQVDETSDGDSSSNVEADDEPDHDDELVTEEIIVTETGEDDDIAPSLEDKEEDGTDTDDGEVEKNTMENNETIAKENMPAMPVVSDTDIADVTQEVSNAYSQLSEFHEELMARRNAALADIKKIQAEYADIADDDPKDAEPTAELSDYMPTDNAVASVTAADLSPVHGADSIMESFDDVLGADDDDESKDDVSAVVLEDTPSIVSKLRDELDHLEKAGTLIDNELNDYDYLLAENRRQCQEFLDNIDTMDGGASAVVSGLITLAQEQGAHNEELNSALKREQALKRHCIDQLGEASKQIEQYKTELDNVRRSLRHSEAARLKSEKFVEDAKTSVQRIVSAAKRKVHQSILQLEAMQAQIDKAEAASAAAENARHEAEIDRDEAFRKRDEALDKLAAEKQHTTELMAECDRQLEGFSNDVLAKMQDQIKRADDAVAAKNASDQRVSELESELAETRTRLIAAQTSVAKKETDLREIRKQRDTAEGEYGDLMLKFNQQKEDMQQTGQTLTHTEADLVAARGEVKRLEKELVQAKDDRDRAIAERLDAIAKVNSAAADQVGAARAERDGAVENLIAAKDEALSANAKLLDAMKSALALPGGFGSRKNKLAAIDAAFSDFIAASQAAQTKGAVVFDDEPIACATITDDAPLTGDMNASCDEQPVNDASDAMPTVSDDAAEDGATSEL